MRAADGGRRWVYLVLTVWSVLWFAILARRGGIDWKFFTTGTSLLFGGHPAVITGITGGHGAAGPAGLPGPPPPGGLHIFASYPALQMGPVAYLATAVLMHLAPGNGVVAAEIALEAAGLAIVALIDRIVTVTRPARHGDTMTLLTGGAVFMIAWTELAAAFAHLDDGLALLLATAAVYAKLTEHPVLAGLAVGLAAGAKPWALVFLPVVLIGHRRLTALAAAAISTAAVYLPFLIADAGTANATRFLIRNEPMSALRALGVTDSYTPRWDRPAQILLGWTLGTLAVLRGRWPAVLLLAGAARIVLDPAAHSYYTPDLVTGALLWDMLGSRRPFPLTTIVTFAALNLTPVLTSNTSIQGTVRLAVVAVIIFATLVLPAARIPSCTRLDAADEPSGPVWAAPQRPERPS